MAIYKTVNEAAGKLGVGMLLAAVAAVCTPLLLAAPAWGGFLIGAKAGGAGTASTPAGIQPAALAFILGSAAAGFAAGSYVASATGDLPLAVVTWAALSFAPAFTGGVAWR